MLFVILGVIGALLPKMSGRGGASATTRGDAGPSAPSETVLQVQAFERLQAYDSNEIAADQRYKGKILQVTGGVTSVKKDILDNIFVTIGTGRQFEIREVQCFFSEEWASKAASLQKGRRITIRGKCDGLMMNVLLKDCEIIE